MTYIWVFIDFWIIMQHRWIQGNDIIFSYTISFLIVQVEQEVFLGNTHIHGSAGKPHGFFYDAVYEQRQKDKNKYCYLLQ